jgi:hypothetical protein
MRVASERPLPTRRGSCNQRGSGSESLAKSAKSAPRLRRRTRDSVRSVRRFPSPTDVAEGDGVPGRSRIPGRWS